MKELLEILRKKQLKIVTAESCTAGMLAAALTEIAGSSYIFERGFITYCNESKMELLGVKPQTLEEFGAVSEQTAKEMAEGAIKNSKADISISITGIAGPDGGSDKKPVGLVYIATHFRNNTRAYKHHFSGSRQDVRKQSVERALGYLLDLAK